MLDRQHEGCEAQRRRYGEMRRRIDTSEIEFRVAAMPMARTVSRQDKTQRMTPDKRPIWVVKLTAFDPGAGAHGSTEVIWVEVAGPEPSLVINQVATVNRLVHAPWVNKNSELVEAFRADSIAMADGGRRAA
jgi:hypothetical protein